jgi:hypothetical protein
MSGAMGVMVAVWMPMWPPTGGPVSGEMVAGGPGGQ